MRMDVICVPLIPLQQYVVTFFFFFYIFARLVNPGDGGKKTPRGTCDFRRLWIRNLRALEDFGIVS